MGVSGCIVCGSMGGWSGRVGNKWQEGPWTYKGLHNYCKNKTGNGMPRPPAMQWPDLTLAEMNNIVEMDSRIISQCFQALWAFFFFFLKNCWVGFWQGEWLQQPVGFQSPSKLFLDSVILMFLNFWFFFSPNKMSFPVSPLNKDFSFTSAFNSSLSWTLRLKHSSQTEDPLPDSSLVEKKKNRRSIYPWLKVVFWNSLYCIIVYFCFHIC